MRQAGLSLFMAIRSRGAANPVLMAEAEYPSLFFNDNAAFVRTKAARPFEQWRQGRLACPAAQMPLH